MLVRPFLAGIKFIDDRQEVFVFVAVFVIISIYDILGFLVQIIVQTLAHRACRGGFKDHGLFAGGHAVNNNVVQRAHRRCPCVDFVQQSAVDVQAVLRVAVVSQGLVHTVVVLAHHFGNQRFYLSVGGLARPVQHRRFANHAPGFLPNYLCLIFFGGNGVDFCAGFTVRNHQI